MANQNRLLILAQLPITLLILAFVPGNLWKMAALLPIWWFSFRGLSFAEIRAFLIINLVFVISDIGAIKNGFFEFTEPDVLGLPAWEFIMWGFYILHAIRLFQDRLPEKLDKKMIVFAIIFSQTFAVLKDPQILLGVTIGLVLLTLILTRNLNDVIFCGYFMLMGVLFEWVGLHFGLWSYPERNFQTALVQFVVMWAGAGLYSRHIVGGWLLRK